MEAEKRITCFESVVEDPLQRSELHYHAWWEIYYLQQGRCSCLIDDTLYWLNSGDFMIIAPYHIHQSSYHSKNHSRLLLQCSEAYLPSEAREVFSQKGFLFRNPTRQKRLSELLFEAKTQIEGGGAYADQLTDACLNLFFFSLLRGPNQYQNRADGSEYVKRALAHINAHYGESELSLAQTAKALFVSPAHLSRTFCAQTGLSFRAYLTDVRMKNAERLLREAPAMNVCEIAYRCGFGDSNYFSAKFKQIYGISPLRFRKKNAD